MPAAVAAIIEQLLAKHPDDRFPSPHELAEALLPYAVSGPTPWDGSLTTCATVGSGTVSLDDTATAPAVSLNARSSALPSVKRAAPGSSVRRCRPAAPASRQPAAPLHQPQRWQPVLRLLVRLALIFVLLVLLALVLRMALTG